MFGKYFSLRYWTRHYFPGPGNEEGPQLPGYVRISESAGSVALVDVLAHSVVLAESAGSCEVSDERA